MCKIKIPASKHVLAKSNHACEQKKISVVCKHRQRHFSLVRDFLTSFLKFTKLAFVFSTGKYKRSLILILFAFVSWFSGTNCCGNVWKSTRNDLIPWKEVFDQILIIRSSGICYHSRLQLYISIAPNKRLNYKSFFITTVHDLVDDFCFRACLNFITNAPNIL